MQHLSESSLAKIKELEEKLKDNSSSSDPATPQLRRSVTLVDICTPLKAGLPKTKKTEVGKQYFRVTNDFYLMELTMMKGGT